MKRKCASVVPQVVFCGTVEKRRAEGNCLQTIEVTTASAESNERVLPPHLQCFVVS